jgi:hypothetical protein
MENVSIFYAHLQYITAIWYALWPFRNFLAVWNIVPGIGKLCQVKSGNPVCM